MIYYHFHASKAIQHLYITFVKLAYFSTVLMGIPGLKTSHWENLWELLEQKVGCLSWCPGSLQWRQWYNILIMPKTDCEVKAHGKLKKRHRFSLIANKQLKWKKALRETQTLHAGCSKAKPKSPPRHRPIPGGVFVDHTLLRTTATPAPPIE